jgi:hypothetical protein
MFTPSKAKLDLTHLSPIRSSSETETNDEGESGSGEKGKETKKRETAFDQLVLPPGHKKMVLSLIAQHFRDKESVTADTEQVDIVRGKGTQPQHQFNATQLHALTIYQERA